PVSERCAHDGHRERDRGRRGCQAHRSNAGVRVAPRRRRSGELISVIVQNLLIVWIVPHLSKVAAMMEMRVFGRTGMRLSVLGFGCGAVGGLMVRGDPRDQERTIARAIDVGVNYFDTAVQYGNGESEKNLGRILQSLKPANAVVGTKVRLPSAKFSSIADTVVTSLEDSLARLRRDMVDIFHLHNAITERGGGETLSVEQVLGEVVPAFERLRQQGKTRFLGLTAVGETAALHRAIDARTFDSAQVVYNMLNPSAAIGLPANYPAQDYGRLFNRTIAAGVGVVGIRVLAGGALSGSTERHPIASPPPEPIGSAMSYD